MHKAMCLCLRRLISHQLERTPMAFGCSDQLTEIKVVDINNAMEKTTCPHLPHSS